MPPILKFSDTPKYDLSAMSRPFFVYTFSEDAASLIVADDLRHIRFESGKFYVNGLRVKNARFGTRSVSWNFSSAAQFTTGQLYLSQDGMVLTGTIAFGKSSEDCTPQTVLATTIRPSVYKSRITKKRWPGNTRISKIPDDQWQDGLELQLGFVYNPHLHFPEQVAKLNGEKISMVPNITKDDLLSLSFTIDDVNCDFDNTTYLEADMLFSTFGEDFSGRITSTCRDKDGKGVFLWQGKVTDQEQAVPGANMDEMAPEGGNGLSIAELLSIVPDSKMLTRANEMMVENMKWAMGQDKKEKEWLSEFFGETTPALRPEREECVKKEIGWYQNQYAKAYLTWGLNHLTGKGAPADKLKPSQASKLETYLKKGLAASSAYNMQMNNLLLDAFISSHPKLRDYMDDGAGKWAERLFGVITCESQIISAVNRIFISHDISPVNNLSTLLLVLDDTGKYAEKYHQLILSHVILRSATRTKIKDEQLTMSWMPEVLETFVTQFGSGKTAAGSSGDKFKIARAVNKAALDMGGYEELAKRFTNLLLEADEGGIIKQSKSACAAFKKQYPDHEDCARVILFVNLVGGVTSVACSLLGWWKDMPTTKKIKMINTCVSTMGKLTDYCSEILKVEISRAGWNKLNTWISQVDTLEDTILIMDEAEGDWVNIAARSTSELFNGDPPVLMIKGTQWEKIFATGEKFLKVLGLVTTVVSTVLSTIKFIKDLKEGKALSTDVIDGVIMISNGLAAVCICLDLAFNLAFFAMASTVFAVIGLAVGFITMFLPTPKSEMPASVFMKKTGIPFVDSLSDSEFATAPEFRFSFEHNVPSI